MSRNNEYYLNPQIFSAPPPNYNLPSSSTSWDFKSPPPGTYVKAVNDHSPSYVANIKRDPSSPVQSYSSEVLPPPTPPFNTASHYPHLYAENPSVANVKVAHSPPSFPISSPISAAEQRTNYLANYLALYYGKRYDGDNTPSSFSTSHPTYPITPESYMFQTSQCLPPLPSQPPPPPPQNPPPPPQNPPPAQNPPQPPQTPPTRSPSSALSTSQYRAPHYSPQRYPQSYSKPFYNNYKRKSDSEDFQKKNAKKRKKPLSQNIPLRKDWSVQDARRALDVEKESNKRSKRQSLIIKFPDLELNRDIVSKFHPSIDNVHFQQPSTPRFCFVTLKDSADPEKIIGQLNKIPFGQGHLVAEFKKDREEDLNIGPEDIDPLTLYVGNLAQEVTKEDMVKCYPKQKRIDIGYAKKMKYTRYAFVSFKSVEDSIEAFKHTHASQMYSKSLIVRFRRLHGTVGMPGEPKPQAAQRNDNESPATSSVNSLEKETEPEFQSSPWDIDVSQWDVDCNMVKQELPEILSDDELDIKPPAPIKSRFMPGSLEVAFSLHKPKIVQIKSEKFDDSDEIIFEQPVVPDISYQNDSNVNINEQRNPVIKIEKESSSLYAMDTTYNNLRSLNMRIDKKGDKRTEQGQVEVKKEIVESDAIPSGNVNEDGIQHDKNINNIRSENLTAQREDGARLNHNTPRSGESGQLLSQTNERYIESNITKSHNSEQSSHRGDKITNHNSTSRNSTPPVSQTNHSSLFNQNTTKERDCGQSKKGHLDNQRLKYDSHRGQSIDNINFTQNITKKDYVNRPNSDREPIRNIRTTAGTSEKANLSSTRNNQSKQVGDKVLGNQTAGPVRCSSGQNSSQKEDTFLKNRDATLPNGYSKLRAPDEKKNDNQNAAITARPEQQQISISSSQSRQRTVDTKEKVFPYQNYEVTGHREQRAPLVMGEILPCKNTETISPSNREQSSNEKNVDIKNQSKMKNDERRHEKLTTITASQEKDKMCKENVIVNKSSQEQSNNKQNIEKNIVIKKEKSTSDVDKNQWSSHSNMEVNTCHSVLKDGQWDSQAKKKVCLENISQMDNERVQNKVPINKADRIRQGTVAAATNDTTKEHTSTKLHNQNSGSRIQVTEKKQGVKSSKSLDPITEREDSENPDTLLSVQSILSMKDKTYAELTSRNQKECVIDNQEVGPQSKESFSRTNACLKQQLMPTEKNITDDQEKEDAPILKDHQPEKGNGLDWMSDTNEIKNEPVDEDHDGDKDDSSDDDFNFNNILSSMKNKVKKKRLN